MQRGEAFDKVAKVTSGFGYPGGPIIDKLAQECPDHDIQFPRPICIDSENFDFSFSGLKTAVMYFAKISLSQLKPLQPPFNKAVRRRRSYR